METVAVFGIGSTNFRYAAAAPDGTFVTEMFVEATQPRNLETQLPVAVDKLAGRVSLDAVAVTAPGLVDETAGVIRDLDTPDGGTVEQVAVRAPIKAATSLPVHVANDCSASALGEWYFGARDNHDCLVHLSIGTGIGGGVVECGRLLRGESGQAGEFGLISVAPDSELASTGVTGAWEAFCSGRGIPSYVRSMAARRAEAGFLDAIAMDSDLDAQAVFRAAKEGDTFARECLAQVDRYNATGVAAVCNAVNPGLVTLGGGVALNNSERILAGIERHLDEYLFVDPPEVTMSPLGDDIGLYGGLGLVIENGERTTANTDTPEV